MPRSSSSSAGATFLDKEKRIEDLRLAARRAADRLPFLRRVTLFGSLVTGTPTPRSDADLLVELLTSPEAEPRNRVPEVLQALLPLPCPVDLFVLTSEEIERHRLEGQPLLRTALENGRPLFERGKDL